MSGIGIGLDCLWYWIALDYFIYLQLRSSRCCPNDCNELSAVGFSAPPSTLACQVAYENLQDYNCTSAATDINASVVM